MASQVHDALRSRIVGNRLNPGAALSGSGLATHPNINRTPLHTTLRRLAGEGPIVPRPQTGSVVAKPDTAQLAEAVFARAALEEAVARRLVRIGLRENALAASLAAQRRAAEDDDYAAFFREDELFHARLAELAGVTNTWTLVHTVKAHVDRQRFRLMSEIPLRAMRAFGEHQEIVRHILAGDGDGAAQAMRSHVRAVLELQPPDPVPSADQPSAAHEVAHQGDRQK